MGGRGIKNTVALVTRPTKANVYAIMVEEGDWASVANKLRAPPSGTLAISPFRNKDFFHGDLPAHYAFRAGDLIHEDVKAGLLELADEFFATQAKVHIGRHDKGKGSRSMTNTPSIHLLGWKKSAKVPFITKETWDQPDDVRLATKNLLEYFKEHVSPRLLSVMRIHDPEQYVRVRLYVDFFHESVLLAVETDSVHVS